MSTTRIRRFHSFVCRVRSLNTHQLTGLTGLPLLARAPARCDIPACFCANSFVRHSVRLVRLVRPVKCRTLDISSQPGQRVCLARKNRSWSMISRHPMRKPLWMFRKRYIKRLRLNKVNEVLKDYTPARRNPCGLFFAQMFFASVRELAGTI